MKSGKYIRFSAFLLVSCLIPLILKRNEYYLHIFILCAINVILANSLRAIAATGQMSIGQAGFMAVGAYTSAILVTKFGLPVYGALLMGGLAATALAAVIGFPLSRVRTIYFVMVTMFLGEIIRLVLFEWRDMTGGSTGMMGIPLPGSFTVLGLFETDFSNRFQFCYLALALLFLTLFVLYNVEHSQMGTVFKSIGREESLAASVGINVAGYKVLIFCIGSFFTGLAGSLYAHYMTVLNPDSFNTFTSLYILIYVIVGGKNFAGPIAGAVILTLIPEVFSGLKEFQPLVYVLVLFLVVFLLPGGLSELSDRLTARIKGSINPNVAKVEDAADPRHGG